MWGNGEYSKEDYGSRTTGGKDLDWNDWNWEIITRASFMLLQSKDIGYAYTNWKATVRHGWKVNFTDLWMQS